MRRRRSKRREGRELPLPRVRSKQLLRKRFYAGSRMASRRARQRGVLRARLAAVEWRIRWRKVTAGVGWWVTARGGVALHWALRDYAERRCAS